MSDQPEKKYCDICGSPMKKTAHWWWCERHGIMGSLFKVKIDAMSFYDSVKDKLRKKPKRS